MKNKPARKSSAIQTQATSGFFFLKQYLKKPLGIGAVFPSSRGLARLMVESIDPGPHDVIVELGPGTGVFTRELLRSGVLPANLILVEFNSHFAKFLRKEFPGLRVIEADARSLPEILMSAGLGRVDKIISGIPLRSMKPVDRRLMTHAISDALKPHGKFVQFSYFNTLPLPKTAAAAEKLSGRRTGVAFTNMPPAFVWQYNKAA